MGPYTYGESERESLSSGFHKVAKGKTFKKDEARAAKESTPEIVAKDMSCLGKAFEKWTSSTDVGWIRKAEVGKFNVNDSGTVAQYERFDVAGTTDTNELILRHQCSKTSEWKTEASPILFHRISSFSACSQSRKRPRSPGSKEVQFSVDRFLFNTVQALAHPLHNYLQCYLGLHNADEIQLMLMPRDGPIAEADTLTRQRVGGLSGAAGKNSNSPVRKGTLPSRRHCYVATNNETVSDEALQAAVKGWGTPSVFQINGFTMVRGEKGRHAEQKLLEHLISILDVNSKKIKRPVSSRKGEVPSYLGDLPASQRALILGERLPCVACRIFSIPFEPFAVLLPSHGHMYLSTVAYMLRTWDLYTTKQKGSKARSIRRVGGIEMIDFQLYLSPASVLKLLRVPGRGRLLL